MLKIPERKPRKIDLSSKKNTRENGVEIQKIAKNSDYFREDPLKKIPNPKVSQVFQTIIEKTVPPSPLKKSKDVPPDKVNNMSHV